MSEYISKDEVIAIIESRQKELCPLGMYSRNALSGTDRETYDKWQEIIDEINNLSTIEDEPAPREGWISYSTPATTGGKMFVCPNCYFTVRSVEFD